MDEYNRCSIYNHNLFPIYLKIFFMHAFFSYPISGVVDKINRQSSLRNFAGISEVPSEIQSMNISADTNQKHIVK